MNEWAEVMDDNDLSKDAHRWIFECPTCRAMFSTKAIFNRTIFPWFGYHPTDGNCQILSDDTKTLIVRRANECDHPGLIKILTVDRLKDTVEFNKAQGLPY